MYVNENYRSGREGKYLSDMLLIMNVLKQVDAFSLFRIDFQLYSKQQGIRRVKAKEGGLKSNGTYRAIKKSLCT